MAANKTKPTGASVTQFLDRVADEKKRADAYEILDMMQKATKAEPKMWGGNMVGFVDFHYVYASGREGDSALIGFSPRKQNLTLYAWGGWEQDSELLQSLGKHSLGKVCLYIKRLDDVDKRTLKKLIANATQRAKKIAALDVQKAH
ncbi:MAG: hypothetical protein B6D41_13465 [Chloroflexi bacterium UTCFX4]|nr:MAG: hypothetical protein B6D41_13465 [Chloroflexi bacterium UTCFX4]